jgi:hypothetical protein
LAKSFELMSAQSGCRSRQKAAILVPFNLARLRINPTYVLAKH